MLVRVFVCRLILSDPPVDLPHSLVCIVDGEAESVPEVAGEMLAVALADRFFRVVDESAGCEHVAETACLAPYGALAYLTPSRRQLSAMVLLA